MPNAEPLFDTLIKKNADVNDTLAFIVDTTNKYSKGKFIQGVVAEIRRIAPDRDSFIRELFNYYCRNVKYVLDATGVEWVNTPQYIILDGRGDCKKAATFLASVLSAANIEPVFKHVYYSNNDRYTHIYVIVPNPDIDHYIVLDPTNSKLFNKEVYYQTGCLYFLNGKKMELRQMGNSNSNFKIDSTAFGINKGCGDMLSYIDDVADQTMGANKMKSLSDKFKRNIPPPAFMSTRMKEIVMKKGVHPQTAIIHDIFELDHVDGSIKGDDHYIGKAKLFSKLKDKLKKSAAKFKTVALSIPRGAFLVLIKLNVHGLATSLLNAWTKDKKKVEGFWKKLGGDPVAFKKAIESGAKKKKILGADDESIGLAIPAMIASATPILILVSKLFKEIAPDSKAAETVELMAEAGIVTSADPKFNPKAAEFVEHQDKSGEPVHPEVYQSDTSLQPTPSQGSIAGSFGGFYFKSLLIIQTFNFSVHMTEIIMGMVAIAAPLLYFSYKKFKLWQTTSNNI